MNVSTTAVATTAGVPETRPKVRASTVRITSASAGEAPGKYLRTPKPRMTRPRLIRSAVTLCAASQEATGPSSSSACRSGGGVGSGVGRAGARDAHDCLLRSGSSLVELTVVHDPGRGARRIRSRSTPLAVSGSRAPARTVTGTGATSADVRHVARRPTRPRMPGRQGVRMTGILQGARTARRTSASRQLVADAALPSGRGARAVVPGLPVDGSRPSTGRWTVAVALSGGGRFAARRRLR